MTTAKPHLLARTSSITAAFEFTPIMSETFEPAWRRYTLRNSAYGEAFVFHCQSGMDTMSSLLALAGLLYAVLRLVERPTPGAAALCALAGFAAFFARPDNGLYALALPLGAIVLVAHAKLRSMTGHHPQGAHFTQRG